jgi:hypothetical protein
MGGLESGTSMNGKIHIVLAAILAAFFFVAGSLKVLNPGGFFEDIQNYDLLPRFFAVGLSFYLPWVEVFCGIALFFRRFRCGALVLISALLHIFIGALVSAWLRGLDISCGCFESQTGHSHYALWIFRDLLLLLGAAVLLRETGLENVRESRQPPVSGIQE